MRRTLSPALAFAVVPALALFAGVPASAQQIRLPQPSPYARVELNVGITKVALEYHRPAVKGRKLFGELVPWGEVWRLGANDATVLELANDATVAGKPLPAGKYALFAVPGKEKWTLIVNREWQQWGHYFRKPSEDVLSFDVKPEAGPFTEWMTFSLNPTSASSARVDWAWDSLRFSFPVEVDVQAIVWKQLDAAMATASAAAASGSPRPDDYGIWMQAARYARETGERKDKAMGWVEKSISIRESFWNWELKARLLDDAGKTADAVPAMEKAIEIAKKGGPPKEYVEGLERDLSAWKAKLPAPAAKPAGKKTPAK